MDKGFHMPCMRRGFDILMIGVQYTMSRGQNTMGRGVNVQWIGGVRHTMGLRVKIQWVGSDIPWIRGLIYHGKGGQNTIGKGSDIPWIGGSIYHG